jgi:serine/threonine protein kinase
LVGYYRIGYPVNGVCLTAAARRCPSSIQCEMSAVSAPALMHSWAICRYIGASMSWPWTEDSWVLVMPRAEKSLRQHVNEVAGPLGTAETVTVLSDIAAALADLDGHVVHRDLKPENVLLLDGRWCLADFSISRYAEASTAADTRKYSWSNAYAAPE